MSYISLHKSHLLDSLENQVLYADLCSVIVGEKGIGKSYFLNQLTLRLDRQVYLSQIEAVSDLTVEQLEKSISLQLGLSWQGDTDLVNSVKERFDKRALVTIDDAHLLSSTCLEFLMLLVSEQLAAKDTHLFIVLAGSAELAKKLSHTSALANNPNICVVFELETIQKSEVKHLIAEFQEIDVGTVQALYDEQKLDYFWQLSDGIPAKVEYQLKRWLNETSLKTEPAPTSSKTKNYLLAVAYSLIAVLLISVLIFQEELNQLVAEKPAPLVEDDSKLGDTQDNLLVKSTEQLAETQLVDEVVAEEPHSDKLKAGELNVDTSVQQPQNDSFAAPPADSQTQIEVVAESRDEIGELIKSLPSEQQSLATTTKSNKPSVQEIEKGPTPLVAQSELTDQPKSTLGNQPTQSKKLLTQDEKFLMAFQDSQYTLQWVGVSSVESANKFRESHPLKEQMYVFRRKQAQGVLYLVVSGQFNSRDDAEHTRIIYQQRNYSGKPWIKSAKAVKTDISSW